MAMITQYINSCNKHMEPVFFYSSDESKASDSIFNSVSDIKSNLFNVTKMSDTSVNVSNPDNASVKDLLNTEDSVVGDSQTVIPRNDISKESSACLVEKSNDILPSDDINALENDVNEAHVSLAANALLDFNTSPPGKVLVGGSPPIPEHVVIHQQKDVSVRKSVASSTSSTLPNSSLSNSHGGEKSTNISPNGEKEDHNNAASSSSNSNTNDRQNDNNEQSDKDDDSQKDFQETPDKFAKAIASCMKKKMLNHIMLNVFM